MIEKSLSEVNESVDTIQKMSFLKRIFSFFGPAYMVSVGYMDPGNWATALQGGSRYGYQLIWVMVMSNLMAIVLQSLCARLGIVYRKDLAQINRETYPKGINFSLYILAELAIAATDLAEVIGMAIGLNLLFGLPLIWGVSITVLDTFILLYLQKLGIRKMEAFIIGLISIIFISFAIELFIVKPNIVEIVKGIKPSFPDKYALYIAIGIIGATVMPHNLYLHSALVQTRKIGRDFNSIKKAIKMNIFDSIIALNLALFVNASILILAATVFYKAGMTDIASIQTAHKLLAPMVGNNLAPILFAIALIAAGQSSTITGTLAGQIVMEGYLQLRINPVLRRLLTRAIAIIPAFIIILLAGEDKIEDLLVFSQVVLSIQLAFAIIPLLQVVSNKEKMKEFVIGKFTIFISVLITAIILFLNIKWIISESILLLNSEQAIFLKLILILGLLFFVLLLLYTIIYPFVKKKSVLDDSIHELRDINPLSIKPYHNLALALDFSEKDNMVISQALKFAKNETKKIILIHVLESATAKLLQNETGDLEYRKDMEQLKHYKKSLEAITKIEIVLQLGFRNRVSEIARICKEEHADILFVGAHGHKGIKDILYGETIEKLRHQVSIPVLILN